MATPTPGKHASAPAVATPPVSTPFSASNHPSHPAFSPHKPHSANPSPQHFKKSPANSNTLFGYGGGGVGGMGHPTNTSSGYGFDSPSAAMALAGVEAGMGEVDMLGLMGTGMGIGGIGGATSEDVKGQKLEEVLEILRQDKGRLSEAGLERLAKGYGHDINWDRPTGSGKKNAALLTIAGNGYGVDIELEDNVVKKVSFEYVNAVESVTKHVKKGEEVLFRDLEIGPGESQLTKKLDRFAANLERLSRLDKMSKMPELNCHEAVAGLYESLDRLHAWEVQRLRESGEMKGKEMEEVVRAAMCTASGKPVMHARDRLGLSLDYWRDKRLLKGSGKEKTYALLIECTKPEYIGFLPVRVSQHWISDSIERPPNVEDELFDLGPVLDWLQPENIMLPPDPKLDGLEGMVQEPKFPDVSFVAKFDPPLMVPDHTAIRVYNSMGLTLDTNTFQPVIYDELLLPRYPGEISDLNKRELNRATTIPIFSKDGTKSLSEHRHNLLIEKRDYGRVLTEIPFSHPQQIVEWLPMLRQAVFLNSLLLKSFGPGSRACGKELDETMNRKSEFEMFMRGDVRVGQSKETGVDVQLSTQPVPRLTIAFPFAKARETEVGKKRKGYAQVVFEIKLNGGVEVVSQNLLDEVDGEGMAVDEGKGRKLVSRDLARMLEITEDIGVWVEFVERRLG